MQTIDDVWNKFATQDELAQAYRDWLFKTSPRGMSEYEGLKLYQQPQVNTDTTVLKNFLRGKKMSNDLSRQLCELCGIEAKLNCINCPHPCEAACNNCSYSDLIYPDFEKPENFVKLLNSPTETIIKNGQTILAKNIWWIINTEAKNYKVLAPYCFEDLLIRLIVILENENKIYSDEFVNRIKQSIREAEWVYED